jgi:hypothetical protein
VRKPNNLLPEIIRIATIVQNVVTEITNMAIDSDPMYIAVEHTKKRAKNPPAAAKDISSDMTMAFMVAARKKSVNTSSPVRETKDTVPTCSKKEKTNHVHSKQKINLSFTFSLIDMHIIQTR